MIDLSERQKESTALATMQRAMEKYAEQNKISFESALQEFMLSKTYKTLFEYESLLWTQGPDYLMDIYKNELV